jgi:hypothetical protein
MNHRPSINIQVELTGVLRELKPLETKRYSLERELRHAKSYETIIKDNIQRDDIVESGGEGKPYFYVDSKFVEWIIQNGLTHKRYAEWNGTLYRMDEFLNTKLRCLDGDVRLDDVINYWKGKS